MQASSTAYRVANIRIAQIVLSTRNTRSRTASIAPCSSRKHTIVQALGNDESERRKTLTRENEPDEYWSSKGEREGESPMKDPLAYIGLLAILFPFLFLGVAIALGWVDLAGGR